LQDLNDGNTATALQMITKMRRNLEYIKSSPNRVITELIKEDANYSELDLSKVSEELNMQAEE
jgi:hypothetical protein